MLPSVHVVRRTDRSPTQFAADRRTLGWHPSQLTRPRSSYRSVYATLEWVDWFNNRRLFGPIGNIRHAEIDWGDESREPRQALGDAAAAQLAGEERHEHYGGARGHSEKQVDRQQGVAQSRPNSAEQDER